MEVVNGFDMGGLLICPELEVELSGSDVLAMSSRKRKVVGACAINEMIALLFCF